MITLYQQHDSGNCYKVRLVLTHLDRPFRTVAVSSFDGSTRRPEFLAKNPIGKVPVRRNSATGDSWRSRTRSCCISAKAPRCFPMMLTTGQKPTSGCSSSNTATNPR